MCRLACFLGMPIQLADLVTKPKRSILTQSYDARERQPHTVEHLTKPNLNGDGFGVGEQTWTDREDIFSRPKLTLPVSLLPRRASKVGTAATVTTDRKKEPGERGILQTDDRQNKGARGEGDTTDGRPTE